MSRITIKRKFIFIGSFVALAIIGLVLLNQYSTYLLSRLNQIRLDISQTETGMLMLRRNEKDFLARNDLKYQAKFNNNYASLKSKVDNLQSSLAIEGFETDISSALAEHLEQYSSIFLKLVATQQKIGLHSKDGLYGNLRKAVHSVENKLKLLNDQHLRADMLQLRRNEKDFMLRLDMKYPKKLQKNLDVMLRNLDESSHSSSDKNSIRQMLDKYRADFMALVESNQIKGLTPKQGLMGEMRNTVHQTETGLVEMADHMDIAISKKLNTQSITRNILSLIFLLGIIGVLLWFAKSMLRSITSLSTTMQKITDDKDLSLRCDVHGRDELGDTAKDFNSMLTQFEAIIGQVSSSSSQLATASQRVSAITEHTNQSMFEQQSQTEQVATAMNQMNATVHEVSKNIAHTSQAAQEAVLGTAESSRIVDQAVQAIQELAAQLEGAADVIHQLEQDSENINKVLEVIKSVAEQTNLLALNAAIEAARAGEQGRGFAVVADEVRTLAARTQQSTGEINQMMEKLQSGSRNAVEVMNRSREDVQAVVEQAVQAGVSLSAINTAVMGINDMSAQIASAAEQQNATAEEINRNIVTITEMSNETSIGSQQTASATEDLARLATDMQGLVAQFRV